jgi:hypothetical protein
MIHNGFRQVLAHRASWEMANGPIKNGLFVCHRCDNPRCVNVEHLFLGDCAANNGDCASKGRTARGTKNGQAKLSEHDVIELRRSYDAGKLLKDIVQRMGISETQGYRIIHRRAWRHV